YGRGWAPLKKPQDGPASTCMRYVLEPDNGDLINRRSVYWVDTHNNLRRVELAGGLIVYELNQTP
ncbi:MAG: hypothetical protein R3236_11295, partial [Phycisphaeraceae bacterium]|nr:hypothetical protein [Phycisphaeraceae bacterium]